MMENFFCKAIADDLHKGYFIADLLEDTYRSVCF